MATSLLFIAVLVFAIRGFFLGFVGVIGKALGLVAGYIIALSYRAKLAAWVSANTTINLPAIVVEVGCGAALFFATLMIVSIAVNTSAGALRTLIPPLKPLLDGHSTTGRITGAAGNAMLGAAIVLIGIWVYGLLGKGAVRPPQLQQISNTFGNMLFNTIIKDHKGFSLTSLTSSIPKTKTLTLPQPEKTPAASQGNAVIVSESNPEKTLSIQTTYPNATTNENSENNSDLLQSLGNGQMQTLLNNPQLQQFAIEQLKDNPQQIKELINKTGITPEQLQELLKKLER